MKLQLVIPTITDIAGNVNSSALGLTKNGIIQSAESQQPCYWLEGNFSTISDIQRYANKLAKNADKITQILLAFPNYYEAIITCPTNETNRMPYKSLTKTSYINFRQDETESNQFHLTLKEATLKQLFLSLQRVNELI